MARIEDYALLGNRRTAALVNTRGSIDWLCVPRFDSPAAFASLIGETDNGHWLLGPVDEAAMATRSYLDGSMALETTYETPGGVIRVIDAMTGDERRCDIVRRIEGVRGSVQVAHEWVVRFGYGKIRPWVHRVPDYCDYGCDEMIVAIAGPDRVTLRGPRLPHASDGAHVDEFEVHDGDVLIFETTYTLSHESIPGPSMSAAECAPRSMRQAGGSATASTTARTPRRYVAR